MIARSDLRKLAAARLKDARALLNAKRYQGAIYLCGYAVEMALNARICRTLHWPGYPATRSEFEKYLSFKTHDLAVLLRLTGIENRILTTLRVSWSIVVNWKPESRYSSAGTAKQPDALSMIQAAERIIKAL